MILRKLELPLLVAVAVGATVGSSIFSLPQQTASSGLPFLAWVSWLVIAIGLGSFIACLANLGFYNPLVLGGTLEQIHYGYGNSIASSIVWSYWLAVILICASYPALLVNDLLVLLNFAQVSSLSLLLIKSSFIWLVALLVSRWFFTSLRWNLALTLLKVLPIFFCLVLLLFFIEPQVVKVNFFQQQLGTWSDLVASFMQNAVSSFTAFVGIIAVTCFIGPLATRKQAYQAIIIAFLIVVPLYFGASLLPLAVLPRAAVASLAEPSLVNLGQQIAGAWYASLLLACRILALVGAYLSWCIIGSVILIKESRFTGIFPAFFSQSGVSGSLGRTIFLNSLLVQAALILETAAPYLLAQLYYVAKLVPILCYFLITLLHLQLITSQAWRFSLSKLCWLGLVTCLALAYNLFTILALGKDLLWMLVLFCLPGLLYYWRKRAD